MDGNKVVNAQNLAELAKKIKEGGGSEQHLYWHSVKIASSFPYLPFGVCIILNNSPTLFEDYTSLQAICEDGGEIFIIDGEGTIGTNIDRCIPVSLKKATGNNRVLITVYNTVSKAQTNGTGDWFSISVSEDVVHQIF